MPLWTELDGILAEGKRLHQLAPDRIARVGALYRSLCTDLARARAAGYTYDLVAHLDVLAARANNAIHRADPYRFAAVRELVAHDFPVSVRKAGRFLAAATALFLVPFAIGLFGALLSTEFASAVLPQSMLEMMAESYSGGFAGGRSEGDDAMMAGFYVYNNVGIAFRCFATGIFFGLGSVFFLVYNGLVTGTVLGYVIHAGAGRNILTFVLGHGSFELTAIVIAGAAGLRMGWALVRTDGLTRLGSLRAHGSEVARLVLGAALMLGVAALIEGFWSPSALPDVVKWSVAATLWLAVVLYLALAGRRGARPAAGKTAP
jgi:uncharacterized membrane protein SpoIIM required for sporulation